jgi:hypothetical protein
MLTAREAARKLVRAPKSAARDAVECFRYTELS